MDKICKTRIFCREARGKEGKFDSPSCAYLTKGDIYCIEELLDDLEKAIDKLDLEADNSISKVQKKLMRFLQL
jgi:hypothetical protein